ncbi:hypothetical protein [Deinococcus hohokamensis]|uniref:Uncharacterized protein n=1 Tax=Deinococcus hohokamensis TaxID=309883 RepID=A0ABV9I8S3_9DEIO
MEDGYARWVEIRLVQTERRQIAQGQVLRSPGPDPLQVGELVRADVEQAVQARYGDDTGVTFRVGQTADVRVHGVFSDKAPVVRALVQGVLAEALDQLDAVD